MAHNYGYYGEPLYVAYPEPRFDRDGRQYHEIAPVTFREPPFYNDVYHYQRSYRDQNVPNDGRHGDLIFPSEQVLIRTEDGREDHGPMIRSGYSTGPWSGPWWHNPDFPHNGSHGGHRIFIVDGYGPTEVQSSSTTVELYAPQLCCDSCERRVIDSLNNIAGVEDVNADQWEKKVVVVGRSNLQPSVVLRRLQRDLRMPRSVFWEDRPC